MNDGKTKINAKRGISNIMFLLKPQWKYGRFYFCIQMFLAVFITPLGSLASVTVAQAVIEKVQSGGAFTDALLVACGYFAVSFLSFAIVSGLSQLYFVFKRQEINANVEREIYEHGLNADFKYVDDPKYYDGYKLATEQFVTKSNEMFSHVRTIVEYISIVISMVTIVVMRGTIVFFLVVISLALFTFIQTRGNKLHTERTKETVKSRRQTDYVGRLLYQTQNAGDLRTTQIRRFLMNSFNGAMRDRLSIMRKYANKIFAVEAGYGFLYRSTTYLVILYVAWGFINGRIENIGVYTTLIAATADITSTIGNLSYFFSQVNETALYAEQVRWFFELESEIETSSDGENAPEKPLTVELRGASFEYPNSGFALKNFNILIKPGQKIAIVGENGAGKSTLMKLLLRLYDLNGGDILYNGKSIKEFNVHNLRRHIGIAFQQPNVYAMTLAENLQAYHETDDAELRKILSEVRLNRLACELNTGVTKEFDENGIMLSGGEAQKLGLARLLTGEFGLLLLDEPSSALDPLAEAEMMQLMFGQANKTTTIMVAHRLSTIRDADCIYLIDNGTITERGTHEELILLGGKYFDMFKKQAENYIK